VAKRTKKVGSTGKFGPRYGVRARVKYRDVDARQRQRHPCPACGHEAVRRVSTAIWSCRKCGVKFTGGAYQPRTDSGVGVEKSIQSVLDKIRSGEQESMEDLETEEA
jgi:large subunit ribosomal protein L37Ae